MLVAVFGQTLLVLAVAMCAIGIAFSIRGAYTNNATLIDRGILASRLLFAFAATASLLLVIELVRHDFALQYVAERISRDLPLPYAITSFWSGQQGSLLLWLTVLAGFGVLAWRTTSLSANARAYANAIVLVVASFFAVLVAFVARPFALAQSVVPDGAGMSPSLQNYWMAIHPPALYLGFVGITIPFAMVMGALLAKERDDMWVRATRRWTLVAWIFLSLGLLLGARWAYEEIGWGGFWAWDPVENAALMPWLTMTAFLHSIMVQERRGMMRFWNVALIALSFCLSIFGTFLTRSGVLSSVHSFVSSSIGIWFIAFLAVAIAASFVALFLGRTRLRAQHDVETVISRETTFLFNNLLLVSISLMVLWGVLYPILSAGIGGNRISLQAPYYNFFLAAFGIPLLFLMGIGPLVSWRQSSLSAVAKLAWFPFAIAVIVGVVVEVFFSHQGWAPVCALSFAAFVLASVAFEFYRGVKAHRSHASVSRAASLRSLFAKNRRRYGGYVVHGGVGLLVIAIVGSTAYTRQTERTIKVGQSASIGAYKLELREIERKRAQGSMQVRAVFDVHNGKRHIGTIRSGKNFYPASGETSNEVGIHHNFRNGEDLFIAVDSLQKRASVDAKILINPLVNLLWFAGIMMVIGAIIALVPVRQRNFSSKSTEPSKSVVDPMDSRSASRV